MAKAGYPDGGGAGPDNFDTSTNAGHYGAGGDSNGQGSSQVPGKPATLDISLGGGFLQGTGSVANNVFDDPQHTGGTITFQSSSVEAALDRSKFPYPRYKIPQNQRRRFQIVNEKQVILNRPIEILDSEGGGDFIMPELDQNNLTFSMSFENTDVIPATSTTFLGSYADVTLGNLRTYSGDIHRMKVYARHQNDQSEEFNRIGDFVVRDKNELIDKTSPTGQAPIGIFYSQSVIDNHWISSSNSITPMSVANNELISAAFLSGSNRGDGEFFDFQTRKYIPLRKAQDYIVNFSSYFIKKPKVQPDGSVIDSAKIELLLSGSINSSQMEVLSLGTISGEGNDSSETLEGRISGSIPNLFNYFRTYSNVAGEASASLVFRVHAGEFHVSNVALRPLTFANFHPDSYNVRLPMPKKAARNQQYDFRVEFYDFNNNKSIATTESTASVFFAGTNDVIDGFDNKIEGAQTWGNSMQAYGVSGNSAYLRSIGYNGFAKTTDGSGERDGGFMLWSGSIGSRITASEAYNGVGLEIVDASATDPSNHRFLQFASNYKNSGNSRFRVQTDEFLLGISSSAANNYISGSNGKLEISSSNFELNGATGNVTLQGTITAAAGGTIGGFTIGTNDLTATNFALNTSLQSIVLGSSNNILIASASLGLSLGHATFTSAPFRVTPAGALTTTNITATGGTIGGWTVGSTLSATNIVLNPAGPNIQLAGKTTFADNNVDGVYIGTEGIAIGDDNEFAVTNAGALTATSATITGNITATTGEIGGFTLDDSSLFTGTQPEPTFFISGSGHSGTNFAKRNLFISASQFQINAQGVISASAGRIGGFTMTDTQLSAGDDADFFGIIPGTGIQMGDSTFSDAKFSVTNAGALKSISGTIGGFTLAAGTLTGGNVQLAAAGTIKVGSVADATTTATTNAGFFADNSGNVLIKGNTNDNDFIKVTGGGGIDIKTQTFKLDTDRLDIDSSTSRISVFDDAGSPKEVIRIGEVDGASNFGMKIFDGTGTADSDILVEFSETQNLIGGWTIDNDSITGGNLILNSAGIVESSTYVSGLKGFRLSAENNGFLEVENAKIRGTLRTTVFEKESVNAVGGQLQVGNATTITGSATITATATSIPVENVTGFTGSEIILAKKVGNTGFSTEYMLITSQSRRDKTSDTDFSGSLFVVRGYSGSVPTTHITSSLGDSPSSPTTLEPGQVLVSTGHFNAATTSGSGYIRMNANPNDPTTPYMDIVERTGSKIYDVDLKARLGDLSGLSTGFVGTNPGFGLFTDRAFLTKDVTVGTLGSEHILISGSYLAFKNNNTIMAQLDGTTWTLGGATGTTTNAVVIGTSGVKIYDNSVDYVSITSAGLSVFEGDASNPVAVFGTDATVGLDEAGKSNVFVDSDGNVDIRRGTEVSASFGTTTTIGPTTGQHVLIDSDSLDVKVGSTVLSTFGTDMTIGKTSGTNRNVFIDSNGNIDIKRGSQVSASFGTTTTIGPTSGQHVSIDSDSFDIKRGSEVSASFGTTTTIGPTTGQHVSIDSDSLDIKVGSTVLSSFGADAIIGEVGTNKRNVFIDENVGVKIRNNTTDLASFGTDMTIGKTAAGNRNVFIDSNGNIDIRKGSEVSASFGTTTTIGPTTGQHVSIDSDSFDIKIGSQVSASFGTTTTIGPTSGDHVLIDNDSVDIKDGSSVLSSFGATTTIGNTATEHVSISSTELKLKDGNGGGTDIDYVTINSSGMQIGDDITISTAGASSLSIGNLANVTDIGDTSTGFLVDSSGNVLIKQGAANKNYMQFNGGVIDLQSDTFNLVTTGSGAGEDGGLIINSAQPLIMVSGSRGTVKGNSVRLLGDEGVLEVSQSGAGVFDTGRTKTFTTTTFIEPQIFKPGGGKLSFISSSIETELPAPTMANIDITSNAEVGGMLKTDKLSIDSNERSTPFSFVNSVLRNTAATNTDGAVSPTASFAAVASTNYADNDTESNCHPAFLFSADYFTELTADDNKTGWVQNGSPPSGSNVFTIQTTVGEADDDDFADAKFNVLGLETNTSDLKLDRQNEYTFLQAKHSGSIRAQLQHDGDFISAGNITAFGTSFLTVSDKREKKDIYQISESLDKVLELRPTKFTWKKTDKQDVGFIAQEVEQVIPEVIETSRGFINTGDDKERKTIAYPKLVPYLVDTIQQLTKRIEELEKKVK